MHLPTLCKSQLPGLYTEKQESVDSQVTSVHTNYVYFSW